MWAWGSARRSIRDAEGDDIAPVAATLCGAQL